MKANKFIQMSKNMVKEYFNRYVAASDNIRKITDEDIMTVRFQEDPDKYQIMLTVITDDDIYYMVTYDRSTDEIYSYICGQDGLRILGRKENLNV